MTPSFFLDQLIAHQYHFVTGVPDSIFKPFLKDMLTDSRFNHVITNNEGESCALAAGYYLATRRVPVVYMQNSGLGNAINPLTSLLDAYIYSIPTLLLVAWRGMPGTKDEPQHARMGEVLPGVLSLLDIGYAIANDNPESMPPILDKAATYFERHKKPYAILFPKGAISASETTGVEKTAAMITAPVRETLLETLVSNAAPTDVLVTTTGKTSRELYEIRDRQNTSHAADFLTVGSMGCASTIGLGIAMEQPDRRVIVVDGDGACLMRLEALATIGHVAPKNFLHIVVDNYVYESTGNQKTLSGNVDIPAVAKACGYRHCLKAQTLADFSTHLQAVPEGPCLLWVPAMPYSRPELGRPKTTPLENKQVFMDYLGV